MSDDKKKNKNATTVLKKVVANKAKPGEAISLDLVKDNALGDYLRVFLGGTDGNRREFLLHHPVGATDLDDDDWVMSEPSDIPYLISRIKDPNAGKISAARAVWLTEQLVSAGLLNKEADGTYVYAGENCAGTRADFFRELKELWKKDDGKKGQKFDMTSALLSSEDPRAKEEPKIRKILSDKEEEANKLFVSTYRTVGGARKDRPQERVEWAGKRTLPEISDILIEHGLSGPAIAASVDASVGVSGAAPIPELLVKAPTGQPNQWCFLPQGVEKSLKGEIKTSLKIIKDKLEADTGEEFLFIIREAKVE